MDHERDSTWARQLGIDAGAIEEFCARWQVQELALFGSGARGALRPDSDLDFLVSFRPEASWSLLDHVRMETELADLVGREVDLVSRRGIERSANTIRRTSILKEARSVYAADRDDASSRNQSRRSRSSGSASGTFPSRLSNRRRLA